MILLCKTVSTNFQAIVTIFVGILGFGSGIAALIFSNLNNKRNLNFLLEKDRRDRDTIRRKEELDLAKDKHEKQKAYNRVLGSFLKLYHSYLQHKLLFSEKRHNKIPDESLILIVDKIDTLNAEIISFKKVSSDEAAILPELTIYLHELINLLDRFEITTQIPLNFSGFDLAQTKLIIQRAHTFAVEELLDEYFSDLIEKIALKAEVSDEFLGEIRLFNSEDSLEKNIEMQNEIMERMLESLSRQLGHDLNINDLL